MAIQELPTLTDGTAHYSFVTELDGVEYEFFFRYGERRAAWIFDLATLEGNYLIRGQMVTVARDLLKRVTDPDKPPGILWAFNISTPEGTSPADRPGLRDLGPGGRCRLYYTEAEET